MSKTEMRYHFDNQYVADPLPFGSIHLVQIGRRYCAPADIIAAHPHRNWFELTLVTGGEGSVITNGVAKRVTAGDIYLSFPSDIHEIRADLGKKLEYDFFSFCCYEPELERELTVIAKSHSSANDRIFQNDRIAGLVQSAIMEFSKSEQPHRELLLADIFHLITLYLIRSFKDIQQPAAHVSEAEILCFQLMSYIDTHIYSMESLTDLASKFNYHYGYLSGLFKKTTGKTLSEYYRHCKMERARVLLLEKIKIGEIAERLHYSLYAFSKAFKATYGISPKAMQMNE